MAFLMSTGFGPFKITKPVECLPLTSSAIKSDWKNSAAFTDEGPANPMTPHMVGLLKTDSSPVARRGGEMAPAGPGVGLFGFLGWNPVVPPMVITAGQISVRPINKGGAVGQADGFTDSRPGRLDIVGRESALHRVHEHEKKDHPGDHLHVAESSGVISELKGPIARPGVQVEGEIPVLDLGKRIEAPHPAHLVDQRVGERPAIAAVSSRGRKKIEENRLLYFTNDFHEPLDVRELKVPGVDMDMEPTRSVNATSQTMDDFAESRDFLKPLGPE